MTEAITRKVETIDQHNDRPVRTSFGTTLPQHVILHLTIVRSGSEATFGVEFGVELGHCGLTLRATTVSGQHSAQSSTLFLANPMVMLRESSQFSRIGHYMETPRLGGDLVQRSARKMRHPR